MAHQLITIYLQAVIGTTNKNVHLPTCFFARARHLYFLSGRG